MKHGDGCGGGGGSRRVGHEEEGDKGRKGRKEIGGSGLVQVLVATSNDACDERILVVRRRRYQIIWLQYNIRLRCEQALPLHQSLVMSALSYATISALHEDGLQSRLSACRW